MLGLETLNFNEYGFYARETPPESGATLRPGEPVRGYIQLADGAAVAFLGTVVRRDLKPEGRFLAVRFAQPTLTNGR